MMITIVGNILNMDNAHLVEYKMKNYSYAFRYMYQRLRKNLDENLVQEIKERFNFNINEYRSLEIQIKSFLNTLRTIEKKRKKRIEDLAEVLDNAEKEKLSKRKKCKIYNKIKFLERSIKNQPVFGGRALLQKITRECNKAVRDEDVILKLKSEYTKRRLLPIYAVGEVSKNGNRFFKLGQISEGKVKYAPCKKEVCNIEFKIPHNKVEDFKTLQELAMSKQIPVTISLNKEKITFSFDEKVLRGRVADLKEARTEVKKSLIGVTDKAMRECIAKAIHRRYYEELRQRNLEGKLERRCVAIDLNPTNIGYSILDVNKLGNVKVVEAGVLKFDKLAKRLKVSSDSEKQLKQNQKRKYELTIALKKLFAIAKHYKCSVFVMEKLEFDGKDVKLLGKIGSREFRRKINGIWNRCLIVNIINRRCNEEGVELREVIPCYTSFIGNIQYSYYDSTNASIEIGRRGMTRGIEGKLYPPISDVDVCTMEAKFGIDVIHGTITKWAEAYKLSQSHCENKVDFECRLRASYDDLPKGGYCMMSISSRLSKTNRIVFNLIC